MRLTRDLKNGDFSDNYVAQPQDKALPAQLSIQQLKKEVAFKTLVDGVKDNFYVIPIFQRAFRWQKEQVENLAVSLYKGLPIPPIYVYRNEQNQMEILDGQQRVLSLYLYYIGKYTKKQRNNQLLLYEYGRGEKSFTEMLEADDKLESVSYKMKVRDIDGSEHEEDISYENLSNEEKRILDYVPITIIEISIDNRADKEEWLGRIFANLNSGGTPLSNQEFRNGIHQSSFYSMLSSFNENNIKWRGMYGKFDKTCRDMEFLLRLSAIRDLVSWNGEDFYVKNFHNYTRLLDEFSSKSDHFSELQIQSYQDSLDEFVKKMPTRIPKKIILWESLFIILNKTSLKVEISEEICRIILKDEIYKKYSASGTTKTGDMEERFKRVYKILRGTCNENS